MRSSMSAARRRGHLSRHERQRVARLEHEQRLKELLVKQARINTALDLDKNERQVAPDNPVTEKTPTTFVERTQGTTGAEMTV